jgi:hypothetical protein
MILALHPLSAKISFAYFKPAITALSLEIISAEIFLV